MYLLFFGVPSIALSKELEEKIQAVAPFKQMYKVLHSESEEFTETFLVKFNSVNSAR